MGKLDFFDSNCMVGPRKLMYPGSFYTPEDLIARMENYGIGRALTRHAYACELDAADGNERLMTDIAALKELTPMWVVMPHHTHEFKAPVELRADLKKNGIRAVAILSDVAHFGFSLAEWNSGVLLSMLEECRIPVFVSMSCFDASFRELHDLLKAHPQLPVVLTEISYRVSRNIFPLMRLFPNLHLESYGYKAQDGIEELCREFGADRVVFGSGMPDASGAAAVAMITYANITDEEKALIASGNLDRLMGGVRI